MTLLCLLVVYYIIWSLLFLRSDIVSPAQKKNHVTIVIVSLALVVPLLVFEVSCIDPLHWLLISKVVFQMLPSNNRYASVKAYVGSSLVCTLTYDQNVHHKCIFILQMLWVV